MVVELRAKPRAVAGLMPVSMVDWEGKLAAIIFLSGCNLRCPYCHNPELIKKDGGSSLPWEKVVGQLSEKKGWVDGVVITGGEPTICDDLIDIAGEIRSAGFPVKLDTNGTHPEVVKGLIEKSLIDFVAMDVKAAFKNYDIVTRVRGQAAKVKETIELIETAGIDHEYRTTIVPGFVGDDDIVEIAKYLSAHGARRYFIQQFNSGTVLEANLRAVHPFPPAYVQAVADRANEFLPTKARGIS